MKYFIITGTSRGLGEAIAENLISPDHHLICISRNKNETLISSSNHMDYFEFDLNNVDNIENMMEQVFSRIDVRNAEKIYLVNNAAVISPLCRIEESSTQELIHNLHINLLAPILLISFFIRFSQYFQIERRVLNISSMSAKNLIPGMSVYSAAKSGLDVFSKCVGTEQGDDSSSVKVISVWPGMIDTSLQEEARDANSSSFASADIFKRAKERGMLASPATVAKKLIALLLGDQFVQGSVIEEL
ncbi:hypothetical protein A8709_27060 [Paenibacillus pectinilyticus]|uniref:Short-chain dehydrogenase n=1 Tax=Paenibacillus pectinilyticus TaxID=512399 RepID=A0A1C1A1R5_9BACL|nr:(S)-benzoin forming benzil reductase [Paenibacillus pectinilyticus]OCT14467.1 hypothetical protein A8709_27060 [Paenibacillus pectinilyticus]